MAKTAFELPAPVRRRTPDEAKFWTNVLAEVPILSHLTPRHLRRVAGLGRIRRFHEGATIMRAGEPGDAMYVVLDGKVSVRPTGRRSLDVGAGAFVGELALLDDGPRTATVVAGTPVITLCITRASFRRLLRTEASIATAIAEELARRLRATST